MRIQARTRVGLRRSTDVTPSPSATHNQNVAKRASRVIANALGSDTPSKTSSPTIVVSTAPVPAGKNEMPPANPLTASTKTAAGNGSATPNHRAAKRTTSPSAKRAVALNSSPPEICDNVKLDSMPRQSVCVCGTMRCKGAMRFNLASGITPSRRTCRINANTPSIPKPASTAFGVGIWIWSAGMASADKTASNKKPPPSVTRSNKRIGAV